MLVFSLQYSVPILERNHLASLPVALLNLLLHLYLQLIPLEISILEAVPGMLDISEQVVVA